MSGTGNEALAAKLGSLLLAGGLRVATAESCTGGLLAGAITSVAGSSDWFDRGFVTYSNDAKIELLGVPRALIEGHGAVSEPVAAAMAAGALAHSRADLAVAVTGIAGPGGGTPAKPVGTVCFAWARRRDGRPSVCTEHLVGDRAAVREASVRIALERLIGGLVAAGGPGGAP
ncbi:MAG TPA: CinA family protein [Casimicrobiaceae bacterium]|nr:CinA family protein [Casimicrobiaceae bacterium]